VQDEYEKDNVADFALWKSWTEEDGDVAWDSPWGRGRPGWHIECSAMSSRYLGESFDIHTGGIDNMFPHHENEIAQSEAASGQPFVKYWMHCAHLQVEGQKMAKSLGNFFTLRDLMDKGYSGREVRYVLLSGHYRQQLNFTFKALDAARSALGRLDGFRERIEACAGDAAAGDVPEWAVASRDDFRAALDDDLNMPEALGALFSMVNKGNRAMDSGELEPDGAAAVVSVLNDLDNILGVLSVEQEKPGDDVLELLEQRKTARSEKNWEASDRIRDELSAMGWEVKDGPTGQQVRRK
jgi:cysteinyl-tRNA synthetase